MRDITHKISTLRTATAQSTLLASAETIARLQAQQIPKGDPLPVAKVAAIQAAKNTSQIIPYCHPMPIESVDVTFELKPTAIITTVTVKAIYKTGVEMEALTAASVATLTLYDMLKMLDEDMTIQETKLCEKTGGKSSFNKTASKNTTGNNQANSPQTAQIIVLSDSVFSGKEADRSGHWLQEVLSTYGFKVSEVHILPDEPTRITEAIQAACDTGNPVDFIITTGGTGISPRDITPDTLTDLIDQEIPGIAEAFRSYSQERLPYAMFSRCIAGFRKQTLILALPGSLSAVQDATAALFPALFHAFAMRAGKRHNSKAAVLTP